MPETDAKAARRDDWVRIHRIELTPDERADRVPPETGDVPFEMWVTGRLVAERADPGEHVTVETRTGRHVEGELVEVNPTIEPGFGPLVPELADVSDELQDLMREIES